MSCLHVRWPKYWSFSVSISSSSSGFISLKIDWFDLLAVQGTFRSLLQHHSSNAWILWHSAFFNSPALTTVCDHWENHSIDYMDLCLCFSTHRLRLSPLSCQEASVFWFHDCSHRPQWFWSPRRGNCHYFHLFPFYLPCSNGARCQDFSFF